MAKNDNLTPDEVLANLVKAFSPKAEVKKEKLNRILVINGNISNEMVSMKQAKKIAKQLATTDAVVKTYKLEGTLSADLTITLTGTEKPKAEAE